MQRRVAWAMPRLSSPGEARCGQRFGNSRVSSRTEPLGTQALHTVTNRLVTVRLGELRALRRRGVRPAASRPGPPVGSARAPQGPRPRAPRRLAAQRRRRWYGQPPRQECSRSGRMQPTDAAARPPTRRFRYSVSSRAAPEPPLSRRCRWAPGERVAASDPKRSRGAVRSSRGRQRTHPLCSTRPRVPLSA
jgi:hypothetical protein